METDIKSSFKRHQENYSIIIKTLNRVLASLSHS